MIAVDDITFSKPVSIGDVVWCLHFICFVCLGFICIFFAGPVGNYFLLCCLAYKGVRETQRQRERTRKDLQP